MRGATFPPRFPAGGCRPCIHRFPLYPFSFRCFLVVVKFRFFFLVFRCRHMAVGGTLAHSVIHQFPYFGVDVPCTVASVLDVVAVLRRVQCSTKFLFHYHVSPFVFAFVPWCSSRGDSPSTFCAFPVSAPCAIPAIACLSRCNAPCGRGTISGCCCGMLRGSSCGILRVASSVLPCGRGSRRVRMPSCEHCAHLRSSSRLASCTSSAPARPSSFWVAAVRTSRCRLLPASVERAAVRSVQPLISLIMKTTMPTIHAMAVQTITTVIAMATTHSQISIRLYFIQPPLRFCRIPSCIVSVAPVRKVLRRT